jgi:hypothetical protein
MKRISLPLILAASAMVIAGTGCLKDKGYDDQEYGLNVGDTKGVSIPLSTSSPVAYGLNASTTLQTVDGPTVNLEVNRPVSSPVTVTLALNNSLATAQGLTALPAGSYNIPSLTLTIPAGERKATAVINIPNASTLDPNTLYGLGFQISTVDQGFNIVSNMKSIVFTFSVKNAWDGKYRLYGGFSRSDQPTYTGVSNSPAGFYEDYYLITKGPSSVDANIDLPTGGQGCTQLIYIIGSGYTYFTGVAPRITVNPATNAVTVTEGVPITAPATLFTQNAQELADSKFYPTGITGHPYSAGKKTIVAHFRWSAGGIDLITKDTLVYKGPR